MLIVDFSGLCIAQISGTAYKEKKFDFEEDEIRYFILNGIKKFKQEFRHYGQLILACDHHPYWRKDIFPYYKSTRAKIREASPLDWNKINLCIRKIKDELIEYMPFSVIDVKGAEADDIIAVLSLSRRESNETVMIISRDQDFLQLQKWSWIKQYNPIERKLFECNNPKRVLFEHIIGGCSGDAIPNILSPENSIVIKERQKSLTKKKKDEWWEKGVPEEYKDRFNLNKKLIDLTQIPLDLVENIKYTYDLQKGKKKNRIMEYFIKYNLSNLAEDIQHFI